MLCWIDRAWSSKESVCCVYNTGVHLDVLSIGCVGDVGSYLLI